MAQATGEKIAGRALAGRKVWRRREQQAPMLPRWSTDCRMEPVLSCGSPRPGCHWGSCRRLSG